MRKFLAVAMIVFTTVAARADDLLAESLKDCSKNQLTMSTCAGHALDKADAELNKAYKLALAWMDSAAAAERLREAQRAWIAFRDKHCLVMVGTGENGGSMYGQLWAGCLEKLTLARIADLQELVDCDEGPCPPTE